MSLADKVLAVNNDLPIRTGAPVHSGGPLGLLVNGGGRRPPGRR